VNIGVNLIVDRDWLAARVIVPRKRPLRLRPKERRTWITPPRTRRIGHQKHCP